LSKYQRKTGSASKGIKCHSEWQNCSACYAKTNKQTNLFSEGQGIHWRLLKKATPHQEGEQLCSRGRQSKDIQCKLTAKAGIVTQKRFQEETFHPQPDIF